MLEIQDNIHSYLQILIHFMQFAYGLQLESQFWFRKIKTLFLCCYRCFDFYYHFSFQYGWLPPGSKKIPVREIIITRMFGFQSPPQIDVRCLFVFINDTSVQCETLRPDLHLDTSLSSSSFYVNWIYYQTNDVLFKEGNGRFYYK